MKYFLPLFLSLLFSIGARGQTITNNWNVREYIPVLRGSYLLESGSFFYAENQSFFSNFPSSFGQKFPLNRLNTIRNLIGYEHRITSHWFTGLNTELRHFPEDFNFLLRPYLFHAGTIGDIQFNKSIGVQWFKERADNNQFTVERNQLRLHLTLQLATQFMAGKKPLEIRAEEEAFWYHSLQDDEQFGGRWVDQSIHKLEAGYNILNDLWIYLGGRISSRYFFREFHGTNGNKLNTHSGGFSFKIQYIFRAKDADQSFKPDTKIMLPVNNKENGN